MRTGYGSTTRRLLAERREVASEPATPAPAPAFPPPVDVCLHPGRTLTFDEFRATHPGPALALDGYVDGPPRWDWSGPWGTFDHHAGVDRLSTRATCEQVALATKAGLWGRLEGDRCLEVHVNDCDADVCLSTWLLRHPERVEEPAVEHLVGIEGCLDATGGCAAGRAPGPVLEAVAWVFDPYRRWRTDPTADVGEARQVGVIDEVAERIDAWADGRPGRLDTSSGYEVLYATEHVVAIEELGPFARVAVRGDGHDCFVSTRRHGGRNVVTVGITSGFVPLDLGRVWRELNRLEGRAEDAGDRWGGSDLIGGSPRASGTALTLVEVCEAVEGLWAA